MKIIRNYILKELLGTTMMSLVVFTFVLIMGNLIKLAELVINKGVDIIRVSQLFMLLIPYVLSYTIPMAILTGTLLAFGRLSADNELNALRASGISMFRIACPAFIIGIILSLSCVVLNDRILPDTSFASRKIIKEIGLRKPAAYLEAGTFIKDFEGYILFVYGIEGNKLYNIRIYQPQKDRPTRTIVADKGELIPLYGKDAIKLKLIDGSSDEPSQKDVNIFYKLLFKTYYLTLKLPQTGYEREIEKKPKDMTIKELKTEMEKLKSQGVDVTPLSVSLHKRIAISVSAFIFIMIGLPLAMITRRQEKSIGFGISLFVIVIYYILLAGGNALALKGTLVPSISIWLPNILLMVTGMALLYKVARV